MKASKPASSSTCTRFSVSLADLPPGYLPASSRSSMTQYDSARGLRALGIQAREIENPGIGQVARFDVAQRREDRLRATRILALPLRQHALDLLSLRVVLRAAQLAGNDREIAGARITLDLRLGDVGQGPDHDVTTVLGPELRRHGLEPAAEEQVEEQGLDDVVPVMAEGDLGDAILARPAVQRAAAQPRAQSAHGLAFGDHPLHHAVRVLLDHVEGHADLLQVVGQYLRGEVRLLLVEVYRDQLEVDGRA